MEDRMEQNWRGVFEYCGDKSNMHTLVWYVYTRDKYQLIKIEFLVSVPHPECRTFFWTCVKDNTIEEKEDYKAIGLNGFDYKLFEEEEGVGIREVLDGYPYLKHIIKFWPGDWEKQIAKINEAVCMNNLTMDGGGKCLCTNHV